MDNKSKLFQIIMLGTFGVLMVGGLAALALFKPDENTGDVPVILSDTVIWGPMLPGGGIHAVLASQAENSPLSRTRYFEKNPATFYTELVEAIATGQGPDAVIVDTRNLLPLIDKLHALPYAQYPLLAYQSTFIDGADVFAMDSGIYAYPLVVDPLVLYWNKDLFRNAGVVKVPADWESFVTTVPKLTILTESADITQSAIAFGEYQNVVNAKEILSALILQTGSSIVKKRGVFVSDLISDNEVNNPTLALKFYMDFSNPVKNVYSWNKTFDRSREAFAANKVAMYGGFLSEREAIDLLNPNLNYGIAVWPQSVRTADKVTYGRFLGVAILKNSRDPGAAYAAAAALTSPNNVAILSGATGLPSAQRNSLVEVPTDPFASIGVQSARIAKTWLEPDAYQTDALIKRAIESVSDGESSERAITTLHEDLTAALTRYVAY